MILGVRCFCETTQESSDLTRKFLEIAGLDCARACYGSLLCINSDWTSIARV